MGNSTAGETENPLEITLKQRFVPNIKLRKNAYQNESISRLVNSFSFINIYLILRSTICYV